MSRQLLDRTLRAAKRHGAVACGTPASLTVKAVDGAGAVRLTLDRAHLWFVQTPQVFRRDWLGHALAQTNGTLAQFTDDAAIVEAAGYPVQMVEGDPYNLKVTTKKDLRIVQAILHER